MRQYVVEYHDERGQIAEVGGSTESKPVSDGRAHEIAAAYVRKHPERAAAIYLEIWKSSGRDKNGKPKAVSEVDTVAEYRGRSFRPSTLRSTMQRQGRQDFSGTSRITVN